MFGIIALHIIFLILLGLFQLYGCTHVVFTRQIFTIRKVLFNLIFSEIQGKTLDIDYVICYAVSDGTNSQPSSTTIAIQTLGRKYLIHNHANSSKGKQDSERETVWLAQEIQDWLRMEE
jgi:hypothetical protein